MAQAALNQTNATVNGLAAAPTVGQAADFHLDTTSSAPPAPPKMVTVKLLKNYRPMERLNPAYVPNPKGDGKYLPPVYEVVGYTREAILKKNAAGMMETVRPEEFVAGELPPAAQVGTGFDTKLWAGAIIKLPADEAKAVRKAGIAEYEVVD